MSRISEVVHKLEQYYIENKQMCFEQIPKQISKRRISQIIIKREKNHQYSMKNSPSPLFFLIEILTFLMSQRRIEF